MDVDRCRAPLAGGPRCCLVGPEKKERYCPLQDGWPVPDQHWKFPNLLYGWAGSLDPVPLV